MPAAIGTALAFIVSNGAAFLGASVAVQATLAAGAAALGRVVLRLGITLGLQLLSSALAPKRNPLPSPTNAQTEIQQPLSPRVCAFGQYRASGTVFWLDAVLDVLYLGIAINHGQISEFVSFHIDSNEVDIDGTDKVTTAPYSANNVYLHHRLGLPTETKYSELLSAFGVDQMRGDGVTTILATIQNPSSAATYNTDYPNGRPTIRATYKARIVWDPRDPAQVRTDETTWQWSENPVLCLLFYMLSPDGFGIPWARFVNSIDMWVAAANVCDEPVPLLAGGTTARYRIAGQFRFTDDPTDVVNQALSTFDGKTWQRGDGSIAVIAGKFVTPTVTIRNQDIVAYETLAMGQDPLTEINGIRAQFLSPDYDYREHEAEPWPTGDAVAELTDDRTATLDLTWVPSVSQARRLMKRAYMRAVGATDQIPWNGTITTNAAGLRAMDERFINVQCDELGISGAFEVGQFTLDPAAVTCDIQISAIDASIDDWDVSEEGTGEGGAFAFVSSFAKVGTTLDVLAEAGGIVGLTCYVACANATGIAATPAGWQLVGKSGPSNGLAIGIFRRVLDGTEGIVTFGSGSGSIMAALFSGMPIPSEVNVVASISTSQPSAQTPITGTAVTTPTLIVAYGATTADVADATFPELLDDTKTEIVGDRTIHHDTGAGITANFRFAIYGFDATLPGAIFVEWGTDYGTNGLIGFAAEAGG